MSQAHSGIRFYGDAMGFPVSAQVSVNLARVGVMAFAKDGQPSTVFAFEDAFDAHVAGRSQRRGGQSVSRSKSVLHALDHRLELRRHQSARLGRGNAKRIFKLRSV